MLRIFTIVLILSANILAVTAGIPIRQQLPLSKCVISGMFFGLLESIPVWLVYGIFRGFASLLGGN